MELPFSREAFFELFVQYNESVWPAQWALYGVGVALAVMALARRQCTSGPFLWPLAALWLWMGLAYHWQFFRAINPVAPFFAALFVVQAVLLVIAGWRSEIIRFRRDGWRFYAGLLLIGYALLLYPALSLSLGQRYPELVTFGLPCPTTIFTIGLLALMVRDRSFLLIIPLIWGVIGGSASWLLGVWPDLGLLVATLVGAALILLPDPQLPRGRL